MLTEDQKIDIVKHALNTSDGMRSLITACLKTKDWELETPEWISLYGFSQRDVEWVKAAVSVLGEK